MVSTPRNALRLHAIPELEKSYPQIVPAIARYARAAQIESDFIEARAAEYISKNLSVGPYGMHLRIPDSLHPALLRRAVRRLCGGDLNAQQLEAVAALADLTRGKTAVRGDLTAERGRSGLYFLQGPPKTIPEAPLLLEGVTRLGELCDVTAGPHPAVPIRDDPFRQVLRRDALEGAVLRTRRNGDRIRPLGCGEKLLSDYLIDRRVDRPLRDCLALVARGGEVLWVCGLGIAEPAALRPGCKEAVRLECRYAFDTRPFALQM